MHEMGNRSSSANETSILKPSEYLFDRRLYLYGEWYTTVTLRLKGNIVKLLPEQTSKGLQTEVTDPTLHQAMESKYVMLHNKIANGLRGPEHK
jgi:hypothetical protein